MFTIFVTFRNGQSDDHYHPEQYHASLFHSAATIQWPASLSIDWFYKLCWHVSASRFGALGHRLVGNIATPFREI